MDMTQPAEQTDTITFDDFVAYGLANCEPSAIHNGEPWHFAYHGIPVTHENSEHYILIAVGKTYDFKQGELLTVHADGRIEIMIDDAYPNPEYKDYRRFRGGAAPAAPVGSQERFFQRKDGYRWVVASNGSITWHWNSKSGICVFDIEALLVDPKIFETDAHGTPLPAEGSPSAEADSVRGDKYPKGFIKDTTKALPPNEFHHYGEGKAHTEQLPGTEGACPKTGPKQPCAPCLTLTGAQLREVLELCGDGDARVTISLRESFVDSETLERQPAGLYAHYTDEPQEGVFGPLDGNKPPAPAPAPAPDAGAQDLLMREALRVTEELSKPGAMGDSENKLSTPLAEGETPLPPCGHKQADYTCSSCVDHEIALVLPETPAPAAGDEFANEVAKMDVTELRRRILVQRDWHQRFASCLDGLKLPWGCNAAMDGCRHPRDIRHIVEKLLERIPSADQPPSEGTAPREPYGRTIGKLNARIAELARESAGLREALAKIKREGNRVDDAWNMLARIEDIADEALAGKEAAK